MKTKKIYVYHIVGIVPKSNLEIVEAENKLDTGTHLFWWLTFMAWYRSFIKSSGVKLCGSLCRISYFVISLYIVITIIYHILLYLYNSLVISLQMIILE